MARASLVFGFGGAYAEMDGELTAETVVNKGYDFVCLGVIMAFVVLVNSLTIGVVDTDFDLFTDFVVGGDAKAVILVGAASEFGVRVIFIKIVS